MMLKPSAFRNRHRNSGKQHEGRRFPAHLAWLRKRPCILDGRHECEGKIEAAHVDEAGSKGMALKVEDYWAVPACSKAHDSIHRGAESWQRKWGVNLIEAAKEYAKRSPHRHLWESKDA